MSQKNWPEYGCHVEMAEGEKPDECVLMVSSHEDCIYAKTPSGRPRKSPHTCKYWKKVAL